MARDRGGIATDSAASIPGIRNAREPEMPAFNRIDTHGSRMSPMSMNQAGDRANPIASTATNSVTRPRNRNTSFGSFMNSLVPTDAPIIRPAICTGSVIEATIPLERSSSPNSSA